MQGLRTTASCVYWDASLSEWSRAGLRHITASPGLMVNGGSHTLYPTPHTLHPTPQPLSLSPYTLHHTGGGALMVNYDGQTGGGAYVECASSHMSVFVAAEVPADCAGVPLSPSVEKTVIDACGVCGNFVDHQFG